MAPPAGLDLRADSLDDARRCIENAYAPHELLTLDRSTIRFRLRQLPTQRLTVGRLSYGAEVELVGPPMLAYHINVPIIGHTTVTQRARSATSGPRTGVSIAPADPVRVRWSRGAVQYPIRVPRVLLDEHLALLLGHPVGAPLTLAPDFPLGAPAGQSLLSCVGFVWSELGRQGGVATQPEGCRQLESLLMSRILYAVPHQYSEALVEEVRPARPSRIQQVIDRIEAHPDHDLSTAVLSAEAGVSARALQIGFRKVTGLSPSTFVRNTRLDRVHAHLLAGTAESITDLAFRYGFGHLGRFAQQYRERFGVRPSEIQRRIFR